MSLVGVSIYPAWSEQPCIVCLAYPAADVRTMRERGMVWLCGEHLSALVEHPLVSAPSAEGRGREVSTDAG